MGVSCAGIKASHCCMCPSASLVLTTPFVRGEAEEIPPGGMKTDAVQQKELAKSESSLSRGLQIQPIPDTWVQRVRTAQEETRSKV